MEKTIEINVKNIREIKSIKFKNPELMNENALFLKIKDIYSTLLDRRDKLYALREEVRKMEKVVEALDKEFRDIQNYCDIEFETTTKEVKTRKSNVVLNGALVYKYNY